MAVGLTLIFGVMRVVNFAHGDMMVWGMYLALMLSTRVGLDPYVSFVVCAAVLFGLGAAVQRGLVDRIIDAPHEMQILLMLGLAVVLENLALVAFGPEPVRVRSPLSAATLWIGPLYVDVARLVTFAVALVLTLGLYLFLFRTELGRLIRASADNTYGAQVIGADVRRIYAAGNYTFAHELGHIKSGHVLYYQIAMLLPVIAELIGMATMGFGGLISLPLEIALVRWQRMSEFTADRAGILACQDVNAAMGASSTCASG
jgi:branched-chain amino acid transport system permease protein